VGGGLAFGTWIYSENGRLKARFPALVVPYPDSFIDPADEDLSIANAPGARRADDRLNSLLLQIVEENQLDLHLGQKIDRVFTAR